MWAGPMRDIQVGTPASSFYREFRGSASSGVLLQP